MRALRAAVVLVLALALSAPVFAADFQAGGAADYATALEEWLPLAEQGDAAAQISLGVMYNNGLGVTQDYAVAIKWYRHRLSRPPADTNSPPRRSPGGRPCLWRT